MSSNEATAPFPDAPCVMVVDDDEMMRDLLATLLEAHGYVVSAFSTGDLAVAALQDGAVPDIILTDMQMPGLNGPELVAALQAAAQQQPVLLGMSASVPSPEIRAKLHAFLAKPFDMTQFAEALESARPAPSAEERHLADSAGFVPLAKGDGPAFATQDHAVPVLDSGIVNALGKTLQASQLRELYTLTLNDVLKRVQRMEAYAEAGDLAALHREAHAVKGSCGMVGARELHLLATTLEGEPIVNTQVLGEFPAACDRLRRMLDEKFPPH